MSELFDINLATSGDPIYKQVETHLRGLIRTAHWPMGTLLPSRKQLAAAYRIDLNTLQRAIAPLLRDGTLRAKRKVGTMVAQPAVGTVMPAPLATEPIAPPAPTPTRHITATLGVVLGTDVLTYPYQQQSGWTHNLLQSIESVFCAAGGTIHTINHWDTPLTDPAEVNLNKVTVMQALLDQGVDGIIVIGINDQPDLRALMTNALAHLPKPAIYITPCPIGAYVPHVFYDQGFSGYRACRHMLEMGYTRLVFISPFDDDWVEERYQGMVTAMRQHRLPDDHLLCLPRQRPAGWDHDPQPEHFHQYVTAMLERLLRDDVLLDLISDPSERCGIIAVNDDTAVPLIAVAARYRLLPGRHFGLIGFDDSPIAWQSNLTSMRTPIVELGRLAAQQMIGALQGDPLPYQVRIASTVIQRTSSARLNAGGRAPIPGILQHDRIIAQRDARAPSTTPDLPGVSAYPYPAMKGDVAGQ